MGLLLIVIPIVGLVGALGLTALMTDSRENEIQVACDEIDATEDGAQAWFPYDDCSRGAAKRRPVLAMLPFALLAGLAFLLLVAVVRAAYKERRPGADLLPPDDGRA